MRFCCRHPMRAILEKNGGLPSSPVGDESETLKITFQKLLSAETLQAFSKVKVARCQSSGVSGLLAYFGVRVKRSLCSGRLAQFPGKNKSGQMTTPPSSSFSQCSVKSSHRYNPHASRRPELLARSVDDAGCSTARAESARTVRVRS
jgi:hypothetical protein